MSTNNNETRKKTHMHTNAINTFWAVVLNARVTGLIFPTVTPTMATMNSQTHIPMAPMRRRRRRPTRSMSWTPTIVITVLTTSAMILKKKKVVIREGFGYQGKFTDWMRKAFLIPACWKKVCMFDISIDNLTWWGTYCSVIDWYSRNKKTQHRAWKSLKKTHK